MNNGKMSSQFSERNIGLDIMRSLAISCILIWHSTNEFQILGLIGVEMFFVLSGFLIGGILVRDFNNFKGMKTILNFWKRRWYRTLPAYYFFLIINIIITLIRAKENFNFSNYIFFVQNFAWPMPGFFGQSWSLSIEEWFYILIPILITTGINCRLKAKRSIIIAALVLGVLSFLVRYFTSSAFENIHWYSGIRKIAILRFDSLMMGIALAYVKFYNYSIYTKLKKTIIPLIGVIILFVIQLGMISDYWNLNAFNKTLIFFICPLSFAFMLPSFEDIKIDNFKIKNLFVKISLWSYSIYLCNNEAFYAAKKLSTFIFKNHPGLTYFLSVPLGLVLSLLIARNSYEWIEKPFLKIREQNTFNH